MFMNDLNINQNIWCSTVVSSVIKARPRMRRPLHVRWVPHSTVCIPSAVARCCLQLCLHVGAVRDEMCSAAAGTQSLPINSCVVEGPLVVQGTVMHFVASTQLRAMPYWASTLLRCFLLVRYLGKEQSWSLFWELSKRQGWGTAA